jgi:predicted HTH domain antitoxin
MLERQDNAHDNVRRAGRALSALRLSPTEFVKEMRVAAALPWYSHGELSQSKAAEIAGTRRAEFIDELAHRRIPVVQVTTQELQNEACASHCP